jgi:hypothetical protein
MSRFITNGLAAMVLFITAGQAYGAINFNDGATHNINYSVSDSVYVDSGSPDAQTTVNLLNSGNIPYTCSLLGFNSSRINVSGGQTDADSSLYVFDNSLMTMSSGSVGWMRAYNSSKIAMFGGAAYELDAFNSSEIVMSGGTVASCLAAYGDSIIKISGGQLGHFNNWGLQAHNDGQIIIDGSDFTINDNPTGLGTFTSANSSTDMNVLRGTLANGDAFAVNFRVWDNASITLVPEPAALLLLGLGAAFITRRRK